MAASLRDYESLLKPDGDLLERAAGGLATGTHIHLLFEMRSTARSQLRSFA